MIQMLKESPLFQLSLTSKELFHSNFIAWLISNYKEESSRILSKFIKTNNKLTITVVKREEKNRDISVYFEDQSRNVHKLVIENKVKSIPDYEQLLRYTSNETNENYILVSLVQPIFNQDDKIYIKELNKYWSYLNYQDLSNLFTEILESISNKNKYHGLILGDYISLSKYLHTLVSDITNDTKKGKYNFYNGGENSKLIFELREVRLHDFFLKLKHELIAQEFHKDLKQAIPDLNLVSSQKWEKSQEGQVFTSSGFTRGTGISEVKYVLCERKQSPVILGVQIQGDQFRLFVESRKEISVKIAEKLLKDNQFWFDFSITIENNITENREYPLNKNNHFNTYGKTFNYRSVKMKECDITKLTKVVTTYINYIHSNKELLIKKIDGAIL